MRVLLCLILLILSQSILAQTHINAQIFDIDLGRNLEAPLIFLSSGQVVFVSKNKTDLLERLQNGLQKKSWFVFTLNKDREIVKLEDAPVPYLLNETQMKSLQEESFTPSILKGLEEAKSIFTEARKEAKENSQCFDRAHVWSYEWRIKRNIYSSKVWLFFTRRFIRKNKFEWWFHVAPMVHVVHNGGVKERILDVKYAKGPLALKSWTDIFMRDNANCPVVKKYSEHANYPESGSCFVMKSSMYYYQPVDLEQLEMTGIPKTRWLAPEVQHAYSEAFNVTL